MADQRDAGGNKEEEMREQVAHFGACQGNERASQLGIGGIGGRGAWLLACEAEQEGGSQQNQREVPIIRNAPPSQSK
jgi:hypothetical protein